MSKKKIFLIILILLILGGAGAFYYFNIRDTDSTLTADERSWIEDNRNNLIDFSLPADIPVLSTSGTGVVFDFLDDLENDTDLEFNRLSSSEETSSDYALELTDKVDENDIVFYQDNYVLVTKVNTSYATASDIQNMTIGVLNTDADAISNYLSEANNVLYRQYDSISNLIAAMNTEDIDAITIPKVANLDTIVSSDNLYIAYNIPEYSKNYVITLGDNETLNNILTKYFNSWQSKFDNSFNSHLAETYFDAKDIDEKEQVEFRSKRYTYGFVLNSPFDLTTKDGIQGFNHSFIDNFADSADIEINYKRYSESDALIDDFNNGDLDIIFNNTNISNFQNDVNNTVSVYNEVVSIITDEQNDIVVNSVNSLENTKVLTVKDSQIDAYLKENGIKTETYNNIDTLINNLDASEVAAIDYYNYDYFVRTKLKTFKNIYSFTLDSDYTYTIRDTNANETFYNYFNFYLTFNDNKTVINDSYAKILNYDDSNRLVLILVAAFALLVILLVVLIASRIIKRRKDHNAKLSKIDKLRYVDSLTSLKNRNYLNENIKKWDESEVYPQALVVIDLNNIAYINDNFGHAEGDKVIVEAASILINNQIPNSELIRTSGNEFLVFVLGQDEKEVIAYIRKLNKEFKKLTHGFGAAIGYSMIVDEIKTVDDAVNEATIAMRHNKEERNR